MDTERTTLKDDEIVGSGQAEDIWATADADGDDGDGTAGDMADGDASDGTDGDGDADADDA
jgi:hypothetical protein